MYFLFNRFQIWFSIEIWLFQQDLSGRKATVISTVVKYIKAVIMVIQGYNSTEILKICDDLKSIEKRLYIKGKLYDSIEFTRLLFLFYSTLKYRTIWRILMLFSYLRYNINNIIRKLMSWQAYYSISYLTYTLLFQHQCIGICFSTFIK